MRRLADASSLMADQFDVSGVINVIVIAAQPLPSGNNWRIKAW